MKNLLTVLLNNIIKILWIIPIDKKKIVFRSSKGEKYNCNPKYISEYIINHSNDYKVVWIFKNPKKYLYLKEQGIEIVKEKSIKSIINLATAKYIIDNHGVQSYMPIRKNQITINTWHGGGSYKKSRKRRTDNQNAYIKKMNDKTKYYISSCQKFSENNLSEIYKNNKSMILPYGMARNDLFFRDTSKIAKKVRSFFSIDENDGIVLFAPTFRRMNVDTDTDIDWKGIVNICKKKYNKNFHFIYRLHEFVENNNNPLKNEKSTINGNQYEDMQELIAASDIIITDYSSLIWDAAVGNKKCFIYATDLNEYINDRDFYTPIKDWPFPLSENNKELIYNIENFNEEIYKENINKHLNDLGSYEDGNASKRVMEFLERN